MFVFESQDRFALSLVMFCSFSFFAFSCFVLQRTESVLQAMSEREGVFFGVLILCFLSSFLVFCGAHHPKRGKCTVYRIFIDDDRDHDRNDHASENESGGDLCLCLDLDLVPFLFDGLESATSGDDARTRQSALILCVETFVFSARLLNRWRSRACGDDDYDADAVSSYRSPCGPWECRHHRCVCEAMRKEQERKKKK